MKKEFVHSVFEAQALAAPQQIAVEYNGSRETYGRLNAQANVLAHVLRASGLGKGVAGLLLEPGTAYVRSLLATLKAGGIFMPLDVKFPPRRIQYMLEQSGAGILITSEDQVDQVSGLNENGNIRKLILLTAAGGLEVHQWEGGQFVRVPQHSLPNNPGNPSLVNDPDDGNYIFYTSGSTGMPKAILGRHVSLAHFIDWEIKEFGLGAKTRVSQLTPVTFDPSLRDILVPLCAGGTLCIPTAGTKADPYNLLTWLHTSQVSLVHIVPSIFRLLVKEAANMTDLLNNLPALQYVLLAGEPLYGTDVINWLNLMGEDVELVNLYGPTETTLAKFFHRIRDYKEVLKAPNRSMPVGKPISNTRALILENGRPCGVGAVGEVYIVTPFMSKGYLQNDELNRQAFLQNPLHNDFEEIVYKTGDLGRYLPDGNVELVGRRDFQVKVNGVRIELEEIEFHLRNFPKIEQSLVMVREGRNGEKKLACYYIRKGETGDAEIREYLRQFLPDAMIPAYFVAMKAFPLLLNGKIDKKALPDPDVRKEGEYQEAATETERKLLAIWKEVLTADHVGVTDNFVTAGGNSLNAIQIMARINKAMNANIRLGDLLKLMNIRNIAAEIDKKKQAHRGIEPLPKRPYYDLSYYQKRFWILEQMGNGGSVFTLPAAYELAGPLDVAAFEKALRTVIGRHESLRTTFVSVAGEPKQSIRELSPNDPVLDYRDVRDQAVTPEWVRAVANAETQLQMDLAKGPLLQSRLLRTGNENHLFLLTMHHIIADGWSMAVLVDEIMSLYNAYKVGLPNPLKPLRLQYRDFAAWHNAQLTGEPLQLHRKFWTGQFANAIPQLQLPTDFPRPAVKTYNGDLIPFRIDRSLTDGLKTLGKTHNVSLFVTLTAALNVLLYKYTGQEDLIVGTSVAGREHADLHNQVGLYINNLALRTGIDSRQNFGQLLKAIGKNTLEAFNHQLYPFEQLIDDLQVPRDQGRSPLFDVLILLQDFDSAVNAGRTLNGIDVKPVDTDLRTSKFDLSFIFRATGDGIAAELEYNTDLFLPATAENIRQDFLNILSVVAGNPNVRLADPAFLVQEGVEELDKMNEFARVVEGF